MKTEMANDKYIFVGGGHLASAFIVGLLESGRVAADIQVVEKNLNKRSDLENRFKIKCYAEFSAVVSVDSAVVLAVRPDDVAKALQQIAKWQFEADKPLIVSCVAGISCQQIEDMFAAKVGVVRAMPNLPAVVGAGVSALYCNDTVDLKQKHMAERLLRATGTVSWLAEESLLHVVTAVSGSGPGYVFRLMRSLVLAAEQSGLSANEARFFVINMFFGSAKMALESDLDLQSLCDQVCVAGGTTAKGVEVLDLVNIDEIFLNMVEAAKVQSELIGSKV